MANTTVETKYGSYNQQLKNEVVRDPKTQWDQDMFLKVLVAQMQYQDPMNPSSDTEFIGQMAQFSTLEQITKMSQSIMSTQAYNLVGKYVLAEYQPEGSTDYITVAGKVDSTFQKNGIFYVVINNPVYDDDGNPVIDTETGKAKVNTYNVPMSGIQEVADGDANLLNEAIWKKLDEIFQLMNKQNPSEPTVETLSGKYVYAEYIPEGATEPVGIYGKAGDTYSKDGVDYVKVSMPKVDGSGALELDADGNAVIEEYEIAVADIKESVEPGQYKNTSREAAWRMLDDMFALLLAAQGGSDESDG